MNDTDPPAPGYESILVAVDCSDHSNAATEAAARLAGLWDAEVTGLHVYAAALHDVRFRQMEGGLPERYQKEGELERQRGVHDDLITRGLQLITDSYLDRTEKRCAEAGVGFSRLGLEGRNYRVVVEEAARGGYDLLVLGSQGLGAVQPDVVGTVCERTVRRASIDTLVVKSPERSLGKGPILVALDGSHQSYGGLLTALDLGERLGVGVHAVAVHDPYFHYVAFDRIAGVLSEQAARVFRFEEQEKLHEDIIDSGLAKIYRAHLGVAESIAEDYGVPLETTLLAGKPYVAILEHVQQLEPSLLVLGKVGVHGDDELDIGGTTENLLRLADTNLLISQRTHEPEAETIARETTAWTDEAEARMEHVPDFVRGMARMAIIRYAQERGHTVITTSIVEEATAELMPGGARQAMEELVDAADEGRLRPAARDPEPLAWSDDALARLERVPEGFMRDASRERVLGRARREGRREITLEVVEAGLAEARGAMAGEMGGDGQGTEPAPRLPWSKAAEALLENVPEGFVRDLTAQRIEAHARSGGRERVTEELMREKLASWQERSEEVTRELDWEEQAAALIAKAPPVVHGMLVREIEAAALRAGLERVTAELVRETRRSWQETGVFHFRPDDEAV